MGRQNFSHQKQNFNMKSLIFLLGLVVLAAATEIEDPSEVGEFEEKEFDEFEERELEESEEFEADEREFEERGVKNCHGFCNVIDLAKSAQISTSSTYNVGNKYSLKTLVDGCTGTKVTSKNLNTCCFHTKKSGSEWVDFRFSKPQFVRGVVIYNRVDCCKGRLFPLEVLVRDEKNKLTKCQGKSFKVGDPEIPSVDTNPIRIDCGAMRGTSVAIRIKNQMLNICEVKIFGF